MNTASCERCGDSAPEPLLRRVELSVDGDFVDGQTLCPDCFSQWISRYRSEMDNDMPAPESGEPDAGDDITIAEETEPAPDIGTGSNALDQTVANAEHRGESDTQSNAQGERSDFASHPTDGDGDIREVGGKPPEGPGSDDGFDVGQSESGDDGAEEDDGGLR